MTDSSRHDLNDHVSAMCRQRHNSSVSVITARLEQDWLQKWHRQPDSAVPSS